MRINQFTSRKSRAHLVTHVVMISQERQSEFFFLFFFFSLKIKASSSKCSEFFSVPGLSPG